MGKTEKQLDEERTTGASYIIDFYREIMLLNDTCAGYMNLMLEIENKYGKEFNEKLLEEEKTILMQTIQNLRFYVHKTFIEYRAIMKGLNKDIDSKIEEMYKPIKYNFVIDRELIDKYVVALNAVLVENVMKNLLETSQDVLKKIYE